MPTPAKPTPEHRPVDRRNFFRKTTAAAALSLSASAYGHVSGANDRVRVAFLGCGGRAQAHINLIAKLAETGAVAPVAVCDVWDGLEEEYDQRHGNAVIRRKFAQGLYPSAAKCGLNPADRTRVAKDYRKILDLKDVDAVCISTPDHWHARMTLDSLAAGKDVYVEKPMTRTADEAVAVMDAAARLNRVVTVGVQSLADPVWKAAHDFLRTGKLGTVSHLSAGAFRSDVRGQWRFYRLAAEMTPRAVDWDLFLGHRFDVGGEPLGPVAVRVRVLRRAVHRPVRPPRYPPAVRDAPAVPRPGDGGRRAVRGTRRPGRAGRGHHRRGLRRVSPRRHRRDDLRGPAR